ncbi:MAG: beta-ketoacyl-ACP synthase II [Kouleothrix sp.]|jgi:beta-ketoacyl-acyl-carrier-protein synthase II|nr:beta-ketoacyl-ACP synthase II [Kouleothrix sp.]
MRRVVITGLGAVTPVGNDVPSMWRALLNGTSGIAAITRFDASAMPIRIAGELKGFTLDPAVDQREARRQSIYTRYALNAVLEAVRAARLEMEREDPEQVGVIYGTGSGGLDLIFENHDVYNERGYRRVAPTLIANMIPDAASGYIAIQLGAQGPNMAVTAACSTGGHNIGEAFETVRRGDAEVIITGSSEAPIHPTIVASFSTMRGLADDNEHPELACKPFDARRNGFILSEGAAALVLESLDHALARGAPIVAELVGYGNSADARDMVAADESGAGAARAMKMALRKAGMHPDAVQYINAHGTGTPLNDASETRAIKTVFGDQAYRLAVSSTKSMLGHMMGAAGSIEALICALVVHDGRIPPTINLQQPDPACDLDYVPNIAREARVDTALSNSIGLGGHNSALILRRYQA